MSIIQSVILHFIVFTLLINSVLLWLQRRASMKPRLFLMAFSLWAVQSIAQGLYATYHVGVPTSYEVLPIANLTCGLAELLMLYLYPIEVLKPNWLNIKRVFWLFTPWLLLWIFRVTIPIEFRYLSSFDDIMKHIGEFNVLVRLLIEFGLIIPYTILLLRIARVWSHNVSDRKFITKYTWAVQIMGLLFFISSLSGSVAAHSIHFLYGSIFCLYITYYDLFLRTHTVSEMSDNSSDLARELSKKSAIRDPVATNPLWKRLTVMMDENELWRESEMTLEDLARRLYTNRTTLSCLIQQQGYSGYTEFINRRRIEAFVANLQSSHSTHTQELLYDVGFRSKSTALRNFRQYMGCTPSEYIRQARLK